MTRSRAVSPLVAGLGLLAVGGLIGLNPGVLDVAVHGPMVVRAALAGAAGLIGVWFLLSAAGRLGGDGAHPGMSVAARPFAEMVRGVRYAFLAVAAIAIGAAFVVGHPLPLVVGLFIAGVDVVETSFLLLVAGRRRPDPGPDGEG